MVPAAFSMPSHSSVSNFPQDRRFEFTPSQKYGRLGKRGIFLALHTMQTLTDIMRNSVFSQNAKLVHIDLMFCASLSSLLHGFCNTFDVIAHQMQLGTEYHDYFYKPRSNRGLKYPISWKAYPDIFLQSIMLCTIFSNIMQWFCKSWRSSLLSLLSTRPVLGDVHLFNHVIQHFFNMSSRNLVFLLHSNYTMKFKIFFFLR